MLLGFYLFFVTCSLISILTLASLFLSEFSPLSREENSTYECGFEHYSYSRLPFSIRYFLLTLIFLIFDMEIMFLLFIPSSYFEAVNLNLYSLLVLLFILVLILGLIYEWVDGSLNWVM